MKIKGENVYERKKVVFCMQFYLCIYVALFILCIQRRYGKCENKKKKCTLCAFHRFFISFVILFCLLVRLGEEHRQAAFLGVLQVHPIVLDAAEGLLRVLPGLKVHKAQEERVPREPVLLGDDPQVLEAREAPEYVRGLSLSAVLWQPFHVECGRALHLDMLRVHYVGIL